MRPVIVLIFHRPANRDARPLERALASAREAVAIRQAAAFLAAGADEVRRVEGEPDSTPFGRRLREAVAGCRGGAIVIGSGGLALATIRDLRRFVEIAAGRADADCLANNYYSADAVAVPDAGLLAAAPDLPADNALPRWLDERAGRHVLDLRRSWRLAFDLDSPADVLLLASAGVVPARLRTNAEALSAMAPLAVERFAAVTGVLHDRGAELLVAGRVSADTVRRLETGSACRIRALVEERGLRASSPLATAGGSRRVARPPRSVLGELLDRDGPAALGTLLARFADAAVVDTRVLLAHRLGADERLWPAAEDRFASDLLMPDAVADPWLRSLTEVAAAAPIPIVLGGHTSVNAGLRLLAGRSEGRW